MHDRPFRHPHRRGPADHHGAVHDPDCPGPYLSQRSAGAANTLGSEEEALQAKEDAQYVAPTVSRWEAIWKWFRPNLYRDYADLRRKVRRDLVQIRYSEEMRNAYYEPCITSRTPTLWIPRDKGGVSQEEVRITSAIVPITDEGAHLNDRNKIIWDKNDTGLPLWQLKILY